MKTLNLIFSMFFNMRNSIYLFIKNICRVCSWLPFLWRDRDWDYHYFLNLMVYKAERLCKTITDNNFIVEEEQERICKITRVFCKLLRRSQNSEWHYYLQIKILERYWGSIIHWNPSSFDKEKLVCRNKEGKAIAYKYRSIIAPEEVIKADLYSIFHREYFEAFEKMDKKSHKDLQKALKILELYIYELWD